MANVEILLPPITRVDIDTLNDDLDNNVLYYFNSDLLVATTYFYYHSMVNRSIDINAIMMENRDIKKLDGHANVLDLFDRKILTARHFDINHLPYKEFAVKQIIKNAFTANNNYINSEIYIKFKKGKITFYPLELSKEMKYGFGINFLNDFAYEIYLLEPHLQAFKRMKTEEERNNFEHYVKSYMNLFTVLFAGIMRSLELLCNKGVEYKEVVRNNSSSPYRSPNPRDNVNKMDRQLILFNLDFIRNKYIPTPKEHQGGTKVGHERRGFWRTSKNGKRHFVPSTKVNGGSKEEAQVTYLSTDKDMSKIKS